MRPEPCDNATAPEAPPRASPPRPGPSLPRLLLLAALPAIAVGAVALTLPSGSLPVAILFGLTAFLPALAGLWWLRGRMAAPPGRHEKAAAAPPPESDELVKRAMGALLTGMGHEIRSPMNAIIGMADLLLQAPANSREQKQYLETIMRSGESLLGLLNGILDHSRIEAGTLDLERVAFDPFEVVESACETLAVAAHDRGLELVQDLDTRLPARLFGDPRRLRQVLIFLLTHAIRQTRSDVVSVTLGPAPSGAIHCVIRDVGLPVARMAAILSGLDHSRENAGPHLAGSGLGLAISRHLVERMGGAIRAESPGPGREQESDLHLIIPLDPDPEAPPRAMEADFSGRHVLLAEDHPVQRAVLQRILGQWNIAVTTVADAGALLATLRDPASDRPPHALLLIDCQLSHLEASDIGGWIRTHPDRVGGTIILLPTGVRRYDLPSCLDMDVARGLIKPIRRAALLQAIREVFGREPVPAVDRRPSAAETGNAAPKILVVDDSGDNRTLAGHMLKKAGFTIAEAGDGMECLERLSVERFDLVLMDVQMPGIDGLEAARAIRGGRHGIDADTLVLGVSAGVSPREIEACTASGMDGFLSKPLRGDSLVEAVRRLLSDPRARGGAARTTRPAAVARPEAPLLAPPTANDADAGLRQGFPERIEANLEALAAALEAGSSGRVAVVAQAIRDDAARLGAERLRNQAFGLLLAARNHDLSTVGERLPDLHRTVAETRAALIGARHGAGSAPPP